MAEDVQTKLMAIINCTPDSFYDGGKHNKAAEAIAYAKQAVRQGADILDVGGESTRPGALPVSVEEELARVVPVIEELVACELPISIDTVKPRVAQKALEAGASIINDVSGFANPEMRALAAESQAQIVVMHMQRTPLTMQVNPCYPDGVIEELLRFFEHRVEELVEEGVAEHNIVLDPGIGFGKSVQHNVTILFELHRLQRLGFPLLIGLSRKSFMTKLLSKPPEDLLSATIAVNTIALLAQVDFIRVHDVQEHRDAIDLVARMVNGHGSLC